jgi:hypothetical protein
METPKFKGVEIELAGEKYIMPPLPIKAFSKGDASAKLKLINDDVKKMQSGELDFSQEAVSGLVSLVTVALQRNYPGLDESAVEDGVEDIMALFKYIQPLISQSDDVKKKMDEVRKNVTTRAFVEAKEKK